MKDIKITKNTRQPSPGGIVEKKVQKVENLSVNSQNLNDKQESLFAGKFLLASLVLSVCVYLFFITSSIFYAINTHKYISKIESLNNLAVEVGYNLNTNAQVAEGEDVAPEKISFANKKDRITFVNKNSDTAISLK